MARPQPADLVAAHGGHVSFTGDVRSVGSPYEDHKFIIECAVGRHGLLQTPDEAEQKARELADYFMRLIRRKEETPGDDMVSRIIDEHVRPGSLSREDFAEIGAMILRAGHDTTTNMIGLGTFMLLNHPEQAAAVRDKPAGRAGRGGRAFALVSPVQFVPRRVAIEDVGDRRRSDPEGRGGIRAQPGRQSRPRGAFADPDKFDVHRDASHHVAFGYGIHQCLGQVLARMELQVVFPLLLERLPDLRIAGTEGDPVQGRHADLRRAQPAGGVVGRAMVSSRSAWTSINALVLANACASRR